MGGDYDVAFTNGRNLEGGETGSGWTVKTNSVGEAGWEIEQRSGTLR